MPRLLSDPIATTMDPYIATRIASIGPMLADYRKVGVVNVACRMVFEFRTCKDSAFFANRDVM